MKLSLHAIRYTSIENQVIYVPIRHTSTFVENPLQNDLFMQNKPNVKYAQINVSSFITSKYVKVDTWCNQKNKPNSNPIKPNFQKAKMNVNLYIIEDYRKKDDFIVRINKPNFRNGQNERKLTYNKGLQKKRLFSRPKNKPNSNPILSAVGGFRMSLKSLDKKSGHTLFREYYMVLY